MRKLFCLSFILSTCLAAQAVPSKEASVELVNKVIGWSLKSVDAKTWVPKGKYGKHPELSTKLSGLFEWTEKAHREADGHEAWLWDVNPIWGTQSSQVKELLVGATRLEGETLVVTVTYSLPGRRSPSLFTADWIVGEENGNPVLLDIRSVVKAPGGTFNHDCLQDIGKAREEYEKRVPADKRS